MEEIFGSYGEIRNLKLNVGKSVKTLSAIVTFKKDRDAEQALINMDGGQIDGNVVKISFVLVSNSKRTTDEDQQPLENDSAGKRMSTGKGIIKYLLLSLYYLLCYIQMIDLQENPTSLILRELRRLIRVVDERLTQLKLVHECLTQRMVKLLPMEEIVVRIETEIGTVPESGTET